MLALRSLRDKYPQYRTMTLGFEKNPDGADRRHARPYLGRTFQAGGRRPRCVLNPWLDRAEPLEKWYDATDRGNRRALVEASLDGWLFYDFRHSDPLAYRILGLSRKGSRPGDGSAIVPARGAARAMVSAVEAERLAS